jgi:uncharacterized protein with HEPN domain
VSADRDRLADVLQAIERIECYTTAGRTVFDTDEFIQGWVVRHLQIIGEAASHTRTLLQALTSAIRDVESTGLTVCAVAALADPLTPRGPQRQPTDCPA